MATEKVVQPWTPPKGIFWCTVIIVIIVFVCCIRNWASSSDTNGPAGTTVVHRFDYVLIRNGTNQQWDGVEVEVFKESNGTTSTWLNQKYTFSIGPRDVRAFVMNKEPDPAHKIRKVVCTIPEPDDPTDVWKCTLECEDPGWQFRNATFTMGEWNQGQEPPVVEFLLAGEGFINNPDLPQDNLVLVHKTATKP
jgi:hypothetical protein